MDQEVDSEVQQESANKDHNIFIDSETKNAKINNDHLDESKINDNVNILKKNPSNLDLNDKQPSSLDCSLENKSNDHNDLDRMEICDTTFNSEKHSLEDEINLNCSGDLDEDEEVDNTNEINNRDTEKNNCGTDNEQRLEKSTNDDMQPIENSSQQTIPKKKSKKTKEHSSVIIVHLLNGGKFECPITSETTGKDVFRSTCDYLILREHQYFGLTYRDNENTRIWVNLEKCKKIRKQIKDNPNSLHFEVKFFPEPNDLKENITKFFLCLQIRNNMIEEKITCSQDTYALLGSYLVQSEFGNYDPNKHEDNYLDDFKFAPNPTPQLIQRLKELHVERRGMTAPEAEIAFLQNAKKLSIYGLDFYPAKDVSQTNVTVGVCSSGLSVYDADSVCIAKYPWLKISKISYDLENFYIKVKQSSTLDGDVAKQQSMEIDADTKSSQPTTLEDTVNFKLCSAKAAHDLWKITKDHHTFFKMHPSSSASNQNVVSSKSKTRHKSKKSTKESKSKSKSSSSKHHKKDASKNSKKRDRSKNRKENHVKKTEKRDRSERKIEKASTELKLINAKHDQEIKSKGEDHRSRELTERSKHLKESTRDNYHFVDPNSTLHKYSDAYQSHHSRHTISERYKRRRDEDRSHGRDESRDDRKRKSELRPSNKESSRDYSTRESNRDLIRESRREMHSSSKQDKESRSRDDRRKEHTDRESKDYKYDSSSRTSRRQEEKLTSSNERSSKRHKHKYNKRKNETISGGESEKRKNPISIAEHHYQALTKESLKALEEKIKSRQAAHDIRKHRSKNKLRKSDHHDDDSMVDRSSLPPDECDKELSPSYEQDADTLSNKVSNRFDEDILNLDDVGPKDQDEEMKEVVDEDSKCDQRLIKNDDKVQSNSELASSLHRLGSPPKKDMKLKSKSNVEFDIFWENEQGSNSPANDSLKDQANLSISQHDKSTSKDDDQADINESTIAEKRFIPRVLLNGNEQPSQKTSQSNTIQAATQPASQQVNRPTFKFEVKSLRVGPKTPPDDHFNIFDTNTSSNQSISTPTQDESQHHDKFENSAAIAANDINGDTPNSNPNSVRSLSANSMQSDRDTPPQLNHTNLSNASNAHTSNSKTLNKNVSSKFDIYDPEAPLESPEQPMQSTNKKSNKNIYNSSGKSSSFNNNNNNYLHQKTNGDEVNNFNEIDIDSPFSPSKPINQIDSPIASQQQQQQQQQQPSNNKPSTSNTNNTNVNNNMNQQQTQPHIPMTESALKLVLDHLIKASQLQQKNNNSLKKTGIATNQSLGSDYRNNNNVTLDNFATNMEDDLPSSAVELYSREKYIKKLNRQERVVDEMKCCLKPYYQRKEINKEEYKNIMRKAVPKICRSKTGEINPTKIRQLVEVYINRAKREKK